MKGFFSRFKERPLSDILEELVVYSKEVVKVVAVPDGVFYFVPSDKNKVPIFSSAWKCLDNEDPPLPGRTKVVILMSPAGSDEGALILEPVPEEGSSEIINDTAQEPVSNLPKIFETISKALPEPAVAIGSEELSSSDQNQGVLSDEAVIEINLERETSR